MKPAVVQSADEVQNRPLTVTVALEDISGTPALQFNLAKPADRKVIKVKKTGQTAAPTSPAQPGE